MQMHVLNLPPSGLSEYEQNPEDASDHIKKLLVFAQDYIPKEKHKETPLYIFATAGMRMIPKAWVDASRL